MAIKKNATTATATIVQVGIDIGYGYTKAVSDTNAVIFPSVESYAHELTFSQEDIAARYPGDQVSDGEGSWFIGDLAMSQSSAGSLRHLRGRSATESEVSNPFRLRMFYAAMGKLLAGTTHGDAVTVELVTGLPVDYMRDAAKFKEMLEGAHKIATDTADFTANVRQVRVMPQPYGSIYSRMLTPDGKVNAAHTAKTTAVVDIGEYTIDVTVDKRGEYISSQSGSVAAGVHTAHDRIADALNKRYRVSLSIAEIDSVLRTKRFMAYGAPVNMAKEVNDALVPLRAAVLNLMSDKFQTGATLDAIYVSGGGAELVFPDVMLAYPHARLMDSPQSANAQGYLNYLKFKS